MEKLGVGDQTDLHEDPFEFDVAFHATDPVEPTQAVDLLTIPGDFQSLGLGQDGDIGQAAQFAHQHGIGFELLTKLHQGDVRHDARQIDGGFHA